MKIVCDSCATKYSISDDKVRGKVFKIRCKKCSHIIVVRGTEQAGAPAAAAAPAAVAAADGGAGSVLRTTRMGRPARGALFRFNPPLRAGGRMLPTSSAG